MQRQLKCILLICFLFFTLNPIEGRRESYITILYDDVMLPAVQVLGASLKATGTQKEMSVLVTKGVSIEGRKRLELEGWNCIPTEEVHTMAMPEKVPAKWKKNLTKLRMWQLVQFDKLVFLDGDMLVLQNIDSLFECAPPLCASWDVPVPNKFNGGLLVLKPNATMFDEMMEIWNRPMVFDDMEQGLLNHYFPLDSLSPSQKLPFKYNAHAYADQTSVMRRVEDVHVLHYTSLKPWIWSSYPYGDLGYLWREYYLRLENRPDHTWILAPIVIAPIIIVILCYFIAMRVAPILAPTFIRMDAPFATIWAIFVIFSALFGLIGVIITFQIIPQDVDYVIAWYIVFEWAYSLYGVPLVFFNSICYRITNIKSNKKEFLDSFLRQWCAESQKNIYLLIWTLLPCLLLKFFKDHMTLNAPSPIFDRILQASCLYLGPVVPVSLLFSYMIPRITFISGNNSSSKFLGTSNSKLHV